MSAVTLTRFAKGDSFVAEGYVRTFQVQRDGEPIQREKFVAKKIGHDLARTNYQVDRTHRSAPGSEQNAASTQTAMVHEAEAAHTGSGW